MRTAASASAPAGRRATRTLVALSDEGKGRFRVAVSDDVELRAEPVPPLGPRRGARDARGVREILTFREDEHLHPPAARSDLRERPSLRLTPERDPIPVRPHLHAVGPTRRYLLQLGMPRQDQRARFATRALPHAHSNTPSATRESGFRRMKRYLKPRR